MSRSPSGVVRASRCSALSPWLRGAVTRTPPSRRAASAAACRWVGARVAQPLRDVVELAVLAAATRALTDSASSSKSATTAAWSRVRNLVAGGGGLRQRARGDGQGRVDVDAGHPGTAGDLSGRDAEGGQLCGHVDLLGGAQADAVLVLGVLPDEPLDLGGGVAGLVGGDDDRNGVAARFDRGEGAPVTEPHPQASVGGTHRDDRDEDAVLLDAGDEVLVEAGVVADVDVHEQARRIDVSTVTAWVSVPVVV